MARINLAGSNIMFLDEIFVNIDSPSIKLFVDLIKEKYSQGNAVYVISHQKDVEEYMEPITKTIIEKKDGFSFVKPSLE